MLSFFKKNTINIIFTITSIPVLLGMLPDMDSNNTIQMVTVYAIVIAWLASGLLIGQHELEEVLLDYIKNKNTARKSITTSKIIIWGFVALVILITLI